MEDSDRAPRCPVIHEATDLTPQVDGLADRLNLSGNSLECPVSQVDSAPSSGRCPFTSGATSRTMKAVRVNGCSESDGITVDDIPVPSPGQDEVLIRVMTMGVDGCDVWRYDSVCSGNTDQASPSTLGTTCAGIIESVGNNVTKFKGGERVYTSNTMTGTWAQYTVAKATWTHHLHGNLSFSQGAAVGFSYHMAFMALFNVGNVKAGQNVLIHGATDGFGLACCQVARAYGLRAVGTADSKTGRQLLLDNGALIAANHSQEDYLHYLNAVTRQEGYHTILEIEAHKNLEDDLNLLKTHGKIVVVGGEGQCQFKFSSLLQKQATILSVGHLNQTDETVEESAAALFAGMRLGWLKPVIGSEYPMTQAVAALSEARNRPSGSHGNIIMSLS